MNREMLKAAWHQIMVIKDQWEITHKLAEAKQLDRWDALNPVTTMGNLVPDRLVTRDEVGLMLVELHNQHDQIGELISIAMRLIAHGGPE